MRKLAFLLLALCACSTKDKYVAISNECVSKTVMVQVVKDSKRLVLEFDKDGNGTFKEKIVKGTYLGAGVKINRYGDILTVRHLFADGKVYSVKVKDSDGNIDVATITAICDRDDLALIKISRRTNNYALCGRSIKVGQEVIAVGNPLGFPFSVTHGIVSALHRDSKNYYNATQSDASINPGNSGGPLFNLSGELIGINAFIVPPVDAPIWTGIGLSIAPDQMRDFIEHNNIQQDGFWSGLLAALGA